MGAQALSCRNPRTPPPKTPQLGWIPVQGAYSENNLPAIQPHPSGSVACRELGGGDSVTRRASVGCPSTTG